MTRSFRTRTRLRGSGGTRVTFSQNVQQSTVPGYFTQYSSRCEDYHGQPIVDSSLFLDEYSLGSGLAMNGVCNGYPSLGIRTEWHDFYDGTLIPVPSHINVPIMSDADCVTKLLSSTNPSRPDIVPFTLLQDLYDIPRMLKDVGKLITSPKKLLSPKQQANQFLGAKFGWLPLVQDVHHLLNLQSAIDKRKQEVQRLYCGLGLRRSYNLDSASRTSSVTGLNFPGSFLDNGVASRDTNTFVEKWGTVRWKPRAGPGWNPNDRPSIQAIRRAVTGLTPEGLNSGAWDLLPWSWIVDWFTNAHAFTMSYSNFIPADSSHICLMTSKTTTIDYRITKRPNGMIGGDGSIAYTTKSRSVNNAASISAHLPFLDGGRLSILGALFVQRFK